MRRNKNLTQLFGSNLANLLANKILITYKDFPIKDYVNAISKNSRNLTYSQRVELHADKLYEYLPKNFEKSSQILLSILGEENKKQIGMFSEFYWVLPIGKFIEKYGLENFEISMNAIEEITKRSTGEYAIRPFIQRYPERTLERMEKWAKSPNFHLRRLASEGLRPKLPWAKKLDIFNHNPEPVFKILEILKEDTILFVKKSVANHLTDWLKINQKLTMNLLKRWKESKNPHTSWIVKRAIRKIKIS